jgi:hypothetical protein
MKLDLFLVWQICTLGWTAGNWNCSFFKTFDALLPNKDGVVLFSLLCVSFTTHLYASLCLKLY